MLASETSVAPHYAALQPGHKAMDLAQRRDCCALCGFNRALGGRLGNQGERHLPHIRGTGHSSHNVNRNAPPVWMPWAGKMNTAAPFKLVEMVLGLDACCRRVKLVCRRSENTPKRCSDRRLQNWKNQGGHRWKLDALQRRSDYRELIHDVRQADHSRAGLALRKQRRGN